MPEARRVFAQVGADRLTYAQSPTDALEGADGLVIATEWRQYRSPDFDRMRKLLREPVIFDGRNLYDPALVRAAGLVYVPIGRPATAPVPLAEAV